MENNLGHKIVFQRRPKSSRSRLDDAYKAQHGDCFYCGRRMRRTDATTDHKTPLVRGGKNSRENIVAACGPCNTAKGPLDAETFIRLRHNEQALKRAKMAVSRAVNDKHKEHRGRICWLQGWEMA